MLIRAFAQAWRGSLPSPEGGARLVMDDWLMERLYALGRWCEHGGEGLVPSLETMHGGVG